MNSTPMTALSYTDASVAGQTAGYIAQSVQGGGISGPSNTAANHRAAEPNRARDLGSAQASANDAPLRPSPTATMARNSAPQNRLWSFVRIRWAKCRTGRPAMSS